MTRRDREKTKGERGGEREGKREGEQIGIEEVKKPETSDVQNSQFLLPTIITTATFINHDSDNTTLIDTEGYIFASILRTNNHHLHRSFNQLNDSDDYDNDSDNAHDATRWW